MPTTLTHIHRPTFSICSSCARKLQSQRYLSTTPFLRALGPESPRYITIPEPPQTPKRPPPPIKGILPVPRNLFGGKKNAQFKTSYLYLESTNPEPSKRITPQGPEADRLLWKQRMSEQRKKNFREGLTELATRRTEITRRNKARSVTKVRRNNELKNMPEREDERLTSPSMTKEIRDLLLPLRPRGRSAEELEAARRRYEVKQAVKKEHRQEAIHSLYMHARNFILTEEQLNETVEKTFGSDEDPIVWGVHNHPTIWGLGHPDTIEKMLKSGEGDSIDQLMIKKETMMQSRLRRVAEMLTGGKMDVLPKSQGLLGYS